MTEQEHNNDASKLQLIEDLLKTEDKRVLAGVFALLQSERIKKLKSEFEEPQDEREQDIQRIKELETELLKLRLKTRHFDFEEDYDRSDYSSRSQKSQTEIEPLVIAHLESLDEPIENAKLIELLVKSIPDLGEKDLEKTNSGSIRAFSTIRSAIVHLQKNKVIARPKADGIKQGHLMLLDKYQKWVDQQRD